MLQDAVAASGTVVEELEPTSPALSSDGEGAVPIPLLSGVRKAESPVVLGMRPAGLDFRKQLPQMWYVKALQRVTASQSEAQMPAESLGMLVQPGRSFPK